MIRRVFERLSDPELMLRIGVAALGAGLYGTIGRVKALEKRLEFHQELHGPDVVFVASAAPEGPQEPSDGPEGPEVP